MRFSFVVLILVLGLVVGTMIYAKDKNEPPEIPVEIIINNPGYSKETQGPVAFPHQETAV